jgi:hypothetical protein
MDKHNFVPDAPVKSRRTTLRSAGLGLAALAALPLLANDADAKKRGKKRKKPQTNRPQPTQEPDRCLPQVEACEKVAAKFCQNSSDPALCRAGLLPCCQPLGTCAGDQSIQCVIDAFTKKV